MKCAWFYNSGHRLSIPCKWEKGGGGKPLPYPERKKTWLLTLERSQSRKVPPPPQNPLGFSVCTLLGKHKVLGILLLGKPESLTHLRDYHKQRWEAWEETVDNQEMQETYRLHPGCYTLPYHWKARTLALWKWNQYQDWVRYKYLSHSPLFVLASVKNTNYIHMYNEQDYPIMMSPNKGWKLQ